MSKQISKHTAWLHVDLAGLEGDLITRTLLTHREALHDEGVVVPDHSWDGGHLALYEMVRTPRTEPRGELRGQIAALWGHAARRGRRIPVMSIPGLWDATAEQVDRVLSVLHGADLHLLVSVPTIATTDEAAWVEARLALWQRHLRPGHVHRVAVHGQDWARVWDRLATLAGLDPTSLPLLVERDAA